MAAGVGAATQSNFERAERRLLETLSAVEPAGPADPRLPIVLQHLCQVYAAWPKMDRAGQIAQQCLELAERHHPQPNVLAPALNNMAVVLRKQGEHDRAETLLTSAADTLEESSGGAARAIVESNRCVARFHGARASEAVAGFRTVLHHLEETLGSHHPDVAAAASNLGVGLASGRALDESETYLKRALAIWEETEGQDSLEAAFGRANLAALFRAKGHFIEAEWFFQRALAIWDRRGRQASGVLQGAFFSNLVDVADTSLLRPVWVRDDLLTLDVPQDSEVLPAFRRQVRELKSRAESGDPEAADAVRRTLEQHGPVYHNVELLPSLWTNPVVGDHPAGRWRILEPFVAKDLRGKSALDIGCNAGFFSRQLKARGAERVIGIDIMTHVLAQARFLSAWYDVPMELREMDTYDVGQLEPVDIVMFVGVLYHLKHPLYALEKISSICKEVMYFQSVVRGPSGDFVPKEDYPNTESGIFDLPSYPKMYFIEKSFNGDVSNWWFATRSCLKAMLRTVGFKRIVDTASSDTFICYK